MGSRLLSRCHVNMLSQIRALRQTKSFISIWKTYTFFLVVGKYDGVFDPQPSSIAESPSWRLSLRLSTWPSVRHSTAVLLLVDFHFIFLSKKKKKVLWQAWLESSWQKAGRAQYSRLLCNHNGSESCVWSSLTSSHLVLLSTTSMSHRKKARRCWEWRLGLAVGLRAWRHPFTGPKRSNYIFKCFSTFLGKIGEIAASVYFELKEPWQHPGKAPRTRASVLSEQHTHMHYILLIYLFIYFGFATIWDWVMRIMTTIWRRRNNKRN